ncbi:MAG: acyltransferase family protein [Myxococcales bacterium]|nr:acyltransferase family protein [Myxococcales bacterium]
MGSSARIDWVDTAKALGIVAIVVGHDPGLPIPVRDFLYTFHVPLFFFMSGVLVKPEHLRAPFGQHVRRGAGRLLTPYVFFWTISFGLWCAFQSVAGKPPWTQTEVAAEHLVGFVLGTSQGLEAVNGPLWFYTALFTSTLALYWLARPTAPWVLPAALAALALLQAGVVNALAGQRVPWNLDLLPIATLFYGAGYAERDSLLSRSIRAPVLAVLLVALFATTALVTHANGKVDMSWQFFGRLYWQYLAGSVAGTLMIVALARLLPSSQLARYLSRNSIIIFSIHFPMYFAFSGIGVYVLGLPPTFESDGSLPPLLYPILSLLLCVPAATILWRFFPWGLGARTSASKA